MKKSTCLLTLLLTALFCLPWGSNAWAEELTVSDGVTQNEYHPIYGYYCDDASHHNQVLYTVSEFSDLANMAGTQISKMKFYSSNASSSWGSLKVNVKLAEISESALSGFNTTSALTLVYSGPISVSGNEMVIEFTEPFDYSGGNLLFDLTISAQGSYQHINFYGVGTYDYVYGYKRDGDGSKSSYFVPKTTFTYEAAGSATCPKPTDLTCTALAATSASFTWNAGGTEGEWQYLCLPATTTADWESAAVKTATASSVPVEDLTPSTEYKFYVRANCVSEQSAATSISFKTPCAEISSLPWSCDFESPTVSYGTYIIPDCWGKIASGNYPYVYNYSYYSHGGNQSLYFYGGNSSPIAIILPPFAEQTSKLQVSFWYNNTSTSSYYGNAQIGYMTDPSDISTFTALKTLDKVSSYTQVKDFALTGAPDNSYIAIRLTGGTYDGYLYVDDISVDLVPSCMAPSAPIASSITSNEAQLAWTANNGETAWKLQYSTDGETWSAEQAINTNPYTLPNLTPNTLYYVRVKAVCSGSDESAYSEIGSFRTACGAVTSFPWTADFAGVTANTIPECWDNSASTCTASYDYYMWGAYSNSGDMMLRLYSAFIAADGIAVINSPYLTIPNETDYELVFDYCHAASCGAFKVRVSVDGAPFADLGSYTNNLSKNLSYPGTFVAEEAISLASFANHTVQFQFYAEPDNGYGAIFIDNIKVRKAPTCIKPAGLAISNISASTADLAWEAGASETAWVVQYKAEGAAEWTEKAVSVNPSCTLTGLTASTTYYVQVKSDCGEGDYSEPCAQQTFKTTCAAESLPFEEEFGSAVPDCWNVGKTGGTYQWASAYDTYAGANTDYYLSFRTGSGSTYSYLQTPPIELTEDAVLTFDWRNSGTNNADLRISTDGGTTFTSITNDLSNTQSSWTTKTFDLSAYTGQTVIIEVQGKNGTASKYLRINNFKVKAKPCDLLTNVKVQPTMDGGTVTWTGDAKKLQYHAGSTGEWTAVAIAEADKAKPHTLTGLAASTSYQVRALSICGDESDEAAWTAPVSFTTKCAPSSVLPYENDFEAETYNSGTLPDCWGKITTSTDYPQVAQGALAYGGSGNFLQFSGSEEQIAILPAFTADLSTLTIQFFYRYRYADFQLGYVKADGATFEAIETLTQSAAYGEAPYEKDLAAIPADAVYLALRMTNTSSSSAQACVDNLVVKVTPACAKPTNLSVSAITAEGATFSWALSEKANETQYQYCVVASSAAPSDWTLLGEDVRTVTVTGKAAHTAYDFYVRSYCGSSEQSETVKLSFTTACAVISALPWEHDFESDETFDIPECWDALDNSGTSYVLGSNGHNAAKCLFVEEGRTTNFQTVILPKFAAELGTLYISFWYKGSAGANYGNVQVGYITDITDQNTFVAVGDPFAPASEYQNAEVPFTGVTADARIAIRYAGGTSDGELYLDDIRVAVISACARPADLAAVATSDGATLTWTDDAASEWTVRYSIKDANSWTEAEHIAATNHTLSGLTTGTTYEVQVKAVCGVGSESDWSEKALFTPVCNLPTDLTVVSTTQTSARITWESLESSWNLQYKAAADAEWLSVNGLTSRDYLLVGLTAGTAYQVRVQAVCGGETFTAPVSFTTKCAPSDVLPYENDFESETNNLLPSCWSKVPEGEYPKVLSGSASYGGEGKCLCFFGASEQLVVLPAFTEPMANLSISFFYRNSTSSLEIGYVESDFVTFHKLADLPNLAAYGASVFEMSLAAAPAEAASIAIRFTGTNAYTSLAYFDNLRVRKTPNCAQLDAPTATPGTNSASISWTAGSETAWNLQYKTGSADWTEVAVSENPYTLSGLAQGTTYKVRVQANCGGGDLSDWSDEASFTTSCSGIAELPYIADFSHALSNCWIIFAEDETDYKPMANTTMNQLTMNGGKNGSSNNVVVMPPFSADLSKAAMSFEYKGTVGNNYAQLEVGYLTDKSDKETFTALATLDQANTWTEARVDLASLPNSAYLAFRYAGATSQGDMAIRNLRILEQLTLADNVDNSATLNTHLGKRVDVTIGRTFVCADYYNTICLPFSLSAEELAASPIASNDLWAFKYAKVDEATGELLFRIVEASSIEAGVPYFIAFPSGDPIVDPLFKNVTISATSGKSVGNDIAKLWGIVDQPEVFESNDQTKLFLAANNTLYWWKGDSNSQLNNFRAFFIVNTGGASHAPIFHGMPARIIKEEQVATGVGQVTNDQVQSLKVLENNQVVIIRNGVKYNVQGQVIEKLQ
ncbi:MAG: fibronectin type III domain-containing protein [Paludibacteraceae bacterium]|nr:fibronectin type III domain-containing protein [Paludibacteraceae bacterium]